MTDASAPAQNLEAEESVLGAMMISEPAIEAAIGTGLRAEDFYRDRHRLIYRAIERLHEKGQPADAISVPNALQQTGELEKAGGRDFVRCIPNTTPAPGNAGHYAQMVRDVSRLRRMHATAQRVLAADSPETAADILSSHRDSSREERTITLGFAPLGEALAGATTETDWVCEDFLAPGAVTVLAGRPKVGKTTKLFALLRALASGGPFLGRKVKQTGVLLLSEERQATLRQKADRWQLLDGPVHLLTRHQAAGADWAEIVAQATAHCLEHDLGVLVIDVWDKWVGMAESSENDSGAVIDRFAPLARAAEQDLAVLVVAHQRKSDGSHGDAIRGSNALAGAVDIIVELERPRAEYGAEPSVRILKWESRFIEPPEELAIELTEDGYEVCGTGGVASLRAESETRAILAVLEKTPDEPWPLDEILVQLSPDAKEGTTRKRLNALAETDSRVERIGKGGKADPYRWRFGSSRPDSLGEETTPTDNGQPSELNLDYTPRRTMVS